MGMGILQVLVKALADRAAMEALEPAAVAAVVAKAMTNKLPLKAGPEAAAAEEAVLLLWFAIR